jgi:endoglucanase
VPPFRPILTALCALTAILALTPAALAAHHPAAHRRAAHHRAAHPRRAGSRASAAAECADRYPSRRDPSNPLMLAGAPGADPLHGAAFFVEGPRYGVVSAAVARLAGLDPARMADTYSWPDLEWALHHGRVAARLRADPALARQVALLAKIASRPAVNRFSLYSGGGGPGAVYRQVNRFFCHAMQADPGTVPVLTTYFLYQHGYCEAAGTIAAARPTFERQVREFAAGIGRRPAVVLIELDAIGASRCMARSGALGQWEADISDEIAQVAALPHVVAYVEGGYSDGNPAWYTAKVLRAVGAKRIRGFFTNDTHSQWTIREIHWGQAVAHMSGIGHFVISTATNGRGPLLNPDPVHQGIEDLCNAPGRGLGPAPSTDTGFGEVDAYLWATEPGESSGGCGGGPPSGIFWPARAIGMAARAQGKLGPGFAGDRY